MRRNLQLRFLVCLSLAPGLSQGQAPVRVPSVSVDVVAALCGLDDRTLAIIALNEARKKRVSEHLAAFTRSEKPKLLTYRAIWAEMTERLENLRASAADNTFDPCEFVTNEAVERAAQEVRTARERFERLCRSASDGIQGILPPKECKIVWNARDNVGIPEPYRWLSLGESCRKRVRRLASVHNARVELAKRYPHLKGKVSRSQLDRRIEKLLSKEQKEEATRFRTSLKQAGLRELDETGESATFGGEGNGI